MKAITICEPYATLICLPDGDPRAKRVENRHWPTFYTGPLLIHAGKSRSFLDKDMNEPWPLGYGLSESDLTFGAIIGGCRIIACLRSADIWAGRVPPGMEWTLSHEHVEGPWCFVLTNVRRFQTPVPYRGSQGFFDVPDAVVAEQIRLLRSPIAAA